MNEQISARITGCASPDVMITSAAPALALLALFLLLVPYNKQLNILDRSVVTGKSQTSAYRIDLDIARKASV